MKETSRTYCLSMTTHVTIVREPLSVAIVEEPDERSSAVAQRVTLRGEAILSLIGALRTMGVLD